jgi:hypothetical protein
VKQEWISVADALPEVGKTVIVCLLMDDGWRDVDVGYYYAPNIMCEDHWKRTPLDGFCGEVTHWMPLPELPE